MGSCRTQGLCLRLYQQMGGPEKIKMHERHCRIVEECEAHDFMCQEGACLGEAVRDRFESLGCLAAVVDDDTTDGFSEDVR